MDHYKVLGLSKNASKPEIKEAFRKLALQFHPDKHSHSSKLIRDRALLKFKQASEAYEVLIDDHKRAHYNQKVSGGAGGGFSRGTGGYGYDHPYHNAKSSDTSYRPRYTYTSGSKRAFDFNATLRFLTSRVFILNLTFASVLLAGAVFIDTSGETLWKMHNSGIIKRGLMTKDEYEEASYKGLNFYEYGQRVAKEHGLLLVDTKYEFGKGQDGTILLIDEEFLRLFKDHCNLYEEKVLPDAPKELVCELAWRYIFLYETITNTKFQVQMPILEQQGEESIHERISKNVLQALLSSS